MKFDRRKYPKKGDATYCLYTDCEICPIKGTCVIYLREVKDAKP